jgi:hypothetical protein
MGIRSLTSSGTPLFPFDRVGERLQRIVVEIGLRQRGDGGRAAEAFLSLPALDPAGPIAERLGDADVMVLALSDVKDVFLLVASRLLLLTAVPPTPLPTPRPPAMSMASTTPTPSICRRSRRD